MKYRKKKITETEISPRIFFDFGSSPRITVSNYSLSSEYNVYKKAPTMRKANVDVYHEDSTVQMPDTPTFSSFQTGLVYGSNTRPLDPIIELQTKNGNSSYYFKKKKTIIIVTDQVGEKARGSLQWCPTPL